MSFGVLMGEIFKEAFILTPLFGNSSALLCFEILESLFFLCALGEFVGQYNTFKSNKILAMKSGIGRQPFKWAFGSFCAVGASVHGEKVACIIGKGQTCFLRPCVCSVLPSPIKRDKVVDVEMARLRENLVGVGVDPPPRDNAAPLCANGSCGKFG